MKDEIKIKAKFDWRKYSLSLVVLAGGIAYFISAFTVDLFSDAKIIIVLTALIWIFFSVRILKDITDLREQLIIDERGIYWRRYKNEFVPWGNIACVTRYSLYQGRYMAVLLKDSPFFKEEDIRSEVQNVHKPLRLFLTLNNVSWLGLFDPTKVMNDDPITGQDFTIPDTLDCGLGRISVAIDYYLEKNKKF